MAHRLWIHVVTALLGGVAGGLAVWLLLLVLPGERSDKPDRLEAESARGTKRAERSVADSDLDIEARLSRLERRSAAAQALGEYAKALSAGQADGGSAPLAQGGVNPDNPVFELAVRGVMEKVDWEKDEEQRVERENRRLERAEQVSAHLSQKLSLTEDQRARVTQVFVDAMETLRELRNPSDPNAAPASRGQWRTRAQEIRNQSDAKLREILDQRQLSTYESLLQNDEELRWWSRFGRGPNRRPQVSP